MNKRQYKKYKKKCFNKKFTSKNSIHQLKQFKAIINKNIKKYKFNPEEHQRFSWQRVDTTYIGEDDNIHTEVAIITIPNTIDTDRNN